MFTASRRMQLGFVFLVVAGLLGVAASAFAQTMAERYPPRVEELRPTPGWAPAFQRPRVTPRRKKIPLRVDWGDTALEQGRVTFGMPFARGVLADVRNARIVDAAGAPAPAEFRVTATWDGPAGSVRWALVHARLRRDREYFVEFGRDVKVAEAPGLQITESDEAFEINTGPMRVVISRREATVVHAVALDLDGDGRFGEDEELVGAEKSRAALPVVVDGMGVSHFAGGVDAGLKVDVVESGPQRAAIRREGCYADAEGQPFCRFITYTYFYAGQTDLRHDHTLIVAFDSNQHQIRDIMLPVPLNLGPEALAVFAGDDTAAGAPVRLAGAGGPYGLVQSRHDAWELVGPGGVLQSGARVGGWFGLSDGRWGAWAGLTDFWQQSPAELETTGNMLRLHLWPSRNADVLDFRPSVQMGADYPGKHVFHGRWYRDGLDEMTQAYGVGKTHNLILNFFPATARDRAWRHTRAQVCQPVLAFPDPDYSCSTEAFFGRMHPRDPERFPEVEALIDSVVETYLRQREQNAQYGWVDFGDVYNTGGLWRRWGSMFYGFVNVMPRLYLRSGRRDVWDFHRVNTRHVTDIDICHLEHPGFKKEKGRRYGGDGCICHYGAELYTIGCDCHLEFMLLDYYLNGNLRVREVARYYLDQYAASRDKEPAMVAYQHRHTGGALRLFSEGYQAFWDPEYLSIMRQCADLLYKAWEKDGVVRHDDVYMNPGKILYYQLTGEERMRELFLNDMRVLSRQRNMYGGSSGGRGATLAGLAHAYWFTGVPSFLPFFAWQLDQLKTKGIGGLQGNFLGRFGTHGYQLPQAMALLADVEELPAPLGPALPDTTACPLALQSDWAFYLHEPQDTNFTVTARVELYGGYGKGFPNRMEWLEQLAPAERPALRIIGPDGAEIRRVELIPGELVQHIKLDLPMDGRTGTYVLVPANRVAPMSVWLADTTLGKHVVHADGNWLSPVSARTYKKVPGVTPRSFFFQVPAGTGPFRVEFKTAVSRSAIEYGIRNAEDELVADGRWHSGASPRNDWETVALDAGGPAEDEVWSFTCGFQAVGDTCLRFSGIPGYVASAPESLFVPEAALRQTLPRIDVPTGAAAVLHAAAGLPWGGSAGYLEKTLTLSAPDGQKMMDLRQGTVEAWVRTADAHDTQANRQLLACGSFSLFRRLNLGLYVGLAGGQMQRFFSLPNNRWTHLAFTWQPCRVKGANLEIRLFADGVEVKGNAIGGSGTPYRNVSADWTGDKLDLPAGIWVGGVRVSDTVRYVENFPRPETSFERDAQTRVLVRFDGAGEAWVLGEKMPLP